jgi:hypothetical protein
MTTYTFLGRVYEIDDRICSKCGRRFRHHHDGLACLVRAAELASNSRASSDG